MTQPSELLDLAVRLATEAGDIVRKGAQARLFSVDTKSSATDPVTEVDKASEAFIVSQIQALRPEDGILGEEGASVESKNGVVWIIDPIDGTTNFIYGVPFFAVSIGVAIDGVPVAGAVYNPAIDELFTAHTGGGAFLNGQKISVLQTSELALALVATGFSYDADVRAEQGLGMSKLAPIIRDFRRMGAASLDLCNVACGRADAYYERGVKPWDVTAASVIVTEAGGVVTGYGGEIAYRDILAACNSDIYDALLPYVV